VHANDRKDRTSFQLVPKESTDEVEKKMSVSAFQTAAIGKTQLPIIATRWGRNSAIARPAATKRCVCVCVCVIVL